MSPIDFEQLAFDLSGKSCEALQEIARAEGVCLQFEGIFGPVNRDSNGYIALVKCWSKHTPNSTRKFGLVTSSHWRFALRAMARSGNREFGFFDRLRLKKTKAYAADLFDVLRIDDWNPGVITPTTREVEEAFTGVPPVEKIYNTLGNALHHVIIDTVASLARGDLIEFRRKMSVIVHWMNQRDDCDFRIVQLFRIGRFNHLISILSEYVCGKRCDPDAIRALLELPLECNRIQNTFRTMESEIVLGYQSSLDPNHQFLMTRECL